MNFHSFGFGVVFLTALAAGRLPWRWQRPLLLVLSYLFYSAAEPWYCLLLLASSVTDYLVGLSMPGRSAGVRRGLLAVSVGVNVGLLAAFKYGDFLLSNLPGLGSAAGDASPLGLELPIGISFYTFQTMAYTLEVYRGRVTPTRDFVSFALYVAFFPQLVAGPIERPQSLLTQISRGPRRAPGDRAAGFQRILWGFFKKLVVADRLGLMVDQVWAAPQEATSSTLLLATAAFTFQLYLDFSAYTDIAIGSARMLGFGLRENFEWPFLAPNPSAFWSRWHMSLTDWFRDYLYLPLGGRVTANLPRTLLNLMVVMGLVGLWHGAAWNYVAFGLVAGGFLAAHRASRTILGRPMFESWPRTAVALQYASFMVVCAVFRTPDLSTWREVIGTLGQGTWRVPSDYRVQVALLGLAAVLHWFRGTRRRDRRPVALPPWGQAAFWLLLVLGTLYGSVGAHRPFIYFQF